MNTKPQPTSVHVYPASSCNLACTYCWNHSGTFGNHAKIMSPETAQSTSNFLTELARRAERSYFSVSIFGGEPMMNRTATRLLMESMIGERENSGTDIRILLFTNGMLLDEEVIGLMSGRSFIECHIGLDGPRETHNLHRIDRKGRGSFDRVADSIRDLIARHVRVVAETLIMPPYDYSSLLDVYQELGVRYAYVQDDLIPGSCNPIRIDAESTLEHWANRYHDFTLDYLHRLCIGDTLLIDPLFGIAKSFITDGEEEPRACTAGEGQVSIDSKGDIYACNLLQDIPDFLLGNVTEGFDHSRVTRFTTRIEREGRIVSRNSRCQNCWIKLKCKGGCYYKNLRTSGAIDRLPDPSVCAYRRIKALIDWEFVQRMKALFPSYEQDLLDRNYAPFFPDLAQLGDP